MRYGRTLYIFLLVGLGAFVMPPLKSQNYDFTHYTVRDGLPFISIDDIYQDRKGNLWLGSYGGLSKFNGQSFTNYGPQDGLVNHYVKTICEDGKGNLWIGTREGISIYQSYHHCLPRNPRFVDFRFQEQLPSLHINELYRDQTGNIWIGTREGLSIYRPSKDTLRQVSHEPVSIHSIVEGNDSMIWLGTDKGLARYTGGESPPLIFLNPPSLQRQLKINEIDIGNGNLWLATASGLYRFDVQTKHFQSFSQESRGVSKSVKCVIIDRQGDMWLGSKKGVSKFDHERFIHFYQNQETFRTPVISVFEDREGNIWLGTEVRGLYKYRGGAFTYYSKNQGLTNSFVFPIFEGPDRKMWVGTKKGIFVRGNGRFHQLTEPSLEEAVIHDAYRDQENTVWLGTNQGLVKYKNETVKRLSRSTTELPCDTIMKVFQDSKGRFWLGYYGGVARYDPTSNDWRTYNPVGLKETQHVDAILEDHSGHLWIGTFGKGIYRFENGQFLQYSDRTGVQSQAILTLKEDEQNNIWVGTFSGVYRFSPEKLKTKDTLTPLHINTKTGLSSDLVYEMMFSEHDSLLWIGTNQGVNKVKVRHLTSTPRHLWEDQHFIEHYGEEEGFKGVECNSEGMYKDGEGNLWFGTVNGLVKYEETEYYKNEKPPLLNLTGFEVMYQDTMLPQHAVLSYQKNNITIRYIGICLTNPRQVRYQHQLVGLEDQWSPITRKTTATYSNLSPGKYQFKVRANNNEGVWTREPLTYSFKVATPFWMTWWFKGIVGGVVLVLLGGVFYYSIRYVQRKNEIRRRMGELKLQALRSQLNPHFIFNCMNAIQKFINTDEKRHANKYLSKFAGLMRLVLENSQQSLVSIEEESEMIELYLELMQLRFPNFSYQLEIEDTIEEENYYIPTMLIQPYVENAIIHGLSPKKEGKGRLLVRFSHNNGLITCTIRDNGIGRQKSEELRKKNGHKQQSSGMQMIRERLNTLREIEEKECEVAIYDLDDQPDESTGTEVVLQIPYTFQ